MNTPIVDHFCRKIVLHIFLQAAKDVQCSDFLGSEAREWLIESGLELLTLAGIGIQPGKYRKWLKDGCPISNKFKRRASRQ
jgi:hypothetical protein